jgi:hypothetical protein
MSSTSGDTINEPVGFQEGLLTDKDFVIAPMAVLDPSFKFT